MFGPTYGRSGTGQGDGSCGRALQQDISELKTKWHQLCKKEITNPNSQCITDTQRWEYDNPFKNLSENLFLIALNKPSTEYISDQAIADNNFNEKTFQNNIVVELSQDSDDMIIELLPQDENYNNELPPGGDKTNLPQDIIVELLQGENGTIEERIKSKKKELYSLLDEVK
ncbi:4849_t:CDS:2, partial [Racocetra fulgida]